MQKNKSLYYYMKMPNENFFVHVFERKHTDPEPIFDNHWHDHIQFFYFTEGNALIQCNSKKITVTAGDFIIINSNELHYGENIGNDLAYYSIRIDFSVLFSNEVDSCQTKFILPLAQNLILFKNVIRNDNKIIECVKKIISEYFTQNIGFELAIKSYIFNLLVLLLRSYMEKHLTKNEFEFQINNLKRFDSILRYIENNFDKEISINTLANMINISKYHFCRLFKQITGKSAVEYINRLRIEKSVSLLSDTNYNITEIAMLCGFNDTNYFSRIFKKYKKVSPTQMKGEQMKLK